MVQEEVIIQTTDEVSTIDYMRTTNEIINAQTGQMQNNIDTIVEQLDTILYNINDITPTQTNNTEINSLIGDINTDIIESNTQDIIIKINQQQEQIDEINRKLNIILEKL